MNATVKYIHNINSLKIEIAPKPKTIIELGIWGFYIIPFSILLLVLLYSIPRFTEKLNLNSIILIGCGIFSMIIVYVFLKSIYIKEVIELYRNTLTLKNVFIFETKKQCFKKDGITDLKYCGVENFTKHTLDPNGKFDYLGIGTAEKEFQFIFEGGKLSFYYNGTIFRFGKNIYEEDGMKIIDEIKNYWS